MTRYHVVLPNQTHTRFEDEGSAREFARWVPCTFRLVAYTTVNGNITAKEINDA